MLLNGTFIKINDTKIEKKPTTTPLVIPPKIIEKVTSPGDNGGYSISTIFPWTFDIIKEEEVFAKAFCIICIAINPGTKKIVNLCPNTSDLSEPMAKLNTVKNRSNVTIGETIVWIHTLKNLCTSFKYNV